MNENMSIVYEKCPIMLILAKPVLWMFKNSWGNSMVYLRDMPKSTPAIAGFVGGLIWPNKAEKPKS